MKVWWTPRPSIGNGKQVKWGRQPNLWQIAPQSQNKLSRGFTNCISRSSETNCISTGRRPFPAVNLKKDEQPYNSQGNRNQQRTDCSSIPLKICLDGNNHHKAKKETCSEQNVELLVFQLNTELENLIQQLLKMKG